MNINQDTYYGYCIVRAFINIGEYIAFIVSRKCNMISRVNGRI